MKDLSTSLSNGLDPIFGASDITAPVTAVPEIVDAATGAATGFALADIPEIPILPVRESSNPPTEGDAATTTSGSTASPSIMSPIVCATINALIQPIHEGLVSTRIGTSDRPQQGASPFLIEEHFEISRDS